MGLLTSKERRDLVDLLLDLPNIEDPGMRKLLISDLPRTLQQAIPFSLIPRVHIDNIVAVDDSASGELADGSWVIALVIAEAARIVQGTRLERQLQQLLASALARGAADPPAPQPPLAHDPTPARLDGVMLKRIQEALLSAFNLAELRSLVRTDLDKDLDHITTGGSLTSIVFELTTWAERNGRLQELVEKARAVRPGNPLLRDLPPIASAAPAAAQPRGESAARPAPRIGGDSFSAYEAALDEMIRRMRGHPGEPTLRTYEQRLRENMSAARLFGDTEERSSRRAEIIYQLNRMALAELGQSFNELAGS